MGRMSRLRLLIVYGLIGCTASSLVVVWVMGTASQEMLHLIQDERAASSYSPEIAAAVPNVMMGVLILGMLVSLVAGVLIGVLLQISSQPKNPQHRSELSPGQRVYTYRPRHRLPLLVTFEESYPVRKQPQQITDRSIKAYRPEQRTRVEAGRN